MTSADGLKTGAQAYDTAAYKVAADDLLLSAGGDVRFHTFAGDAVTECGNRNRRDLLHLKDSEGHACSTGPKSPDSPDAKLARKVGDDNPNPGNNGFVGVIGNAGNPNILPTDFAL